MLDIDGNRLDARFIDNTGAVGDYFTMMKGGTTQKPQADFDDRKTDVSVYQMSSGNWLCALEAGFRPAFEFWRC